MKYIINELVNSLNTCGGEAYLIGGYIRDKLLNIKDCSKDIDVIYKGNLDKYINNLKEKGYKFFVVNEDLCIYRFIINNKILDITKMKGDNIEEDLLKRDFTINSIALKLIDNKIMDPFKGRKDIEYRILRAVRKESIIKDPIRILRGIRFYIKYGLHFSKDTEKIILSETNSILKCAKERVFKEFMSIIQCDESGVAFELLDSYNVLKTLLPYTEELKTVGKCKYHVVDAFTHMNIAYKYFKQTFYNKKDFMEFNINFLNEKLGEFYIKDYVAFSVFVHDIGKFKCYKLNKGKVSFYGHNLEGAKIINNFCDYFKFPKKSKELITIIVEGHMYPLGLFKNFNNNYKNEFYKFFYKYNKYVPYILIVSFCDMCATKSLLDKNNELEKYKKFIKILFKEYYIYTNILNNKLLKGNEVAGIIDIDQNKIGKVMNYIDKIRYINDIKDKDNIISYIKASCKNFN